VAVGFKWFTLGLFDGSCCFGGEESAGASFLRRDGTAWSTDKDGLILGLLAAEITARTGKDPHCAIRSLRVFTLGDEILEVAKQKGVNVEFVSRARIGLPTGTVVATVDALGNANYELVQPTAWDEIIVSAEALEGVAKAGAFIFGSLATRSPYNLEQLDRRCSLNSCSTFDRVFRRKLLNS
jgi:hypothetical protein